MWTSQPDETLKRCHAQRRAIARVITSPGLWASAALNLKIAPLVVHDHGARTSPTRSEGVEQLSQIAPSSGSPPDPASAGLEETAVQRRVSSPPPKDQQETTFGRSDAIAELPNPNAQNATVMHAAAKWMAARTTLLQQRWGTIDLQVHSSSIRACGNTQTWGGRAQPLHHPGVGGQGFDHLLVASGGEGLPVRSFDPRSPPPHARTPRGGCTWAAPLALRSRQVR